MEVSGQGPAPGMRRPGSAQKKAGNTLTFVLTRRQWVSKQVKGWENNWNEMRCPGMRELKTEVRLTPLTTGACPKVQNWLVQMTGHTQGRENSF